MNSNKPGHIINDIDSNNEEEKQKMLDRLKRFGPVDKSEISTFMKRANYGNTIINHKDHFSSVKEEGKCFCKKEFKIDMDELSEFDFKRLYLFGVNYMTTNDVEEYFNEFKVKKIFWINDYSCKGIFYVLGVAEFDNENKAREAFETMTNTKVNPNLSNEENYNWKPAKSYTVEDKTLDLYIRFSSKTDLMKKSDGKNSNFYRFYNSKLKSDAMVKRHKRRERSRDRLNFDKKQEILSMERNRESQGILKKETLLEDNEDNEDN